MTQNLLNSYISESHTIRSSQDAIRDQLLASLHKLHETQDQTQVALCNLYDAISPRRQIQDQSSNNCSDEKSRVLPSDANSPNARVCSSPVAGMTVQQIERTVCRRSCACQCHIRSQWSSHPILKTIIGSLFLGYSGTPQIVPKCDSVSCHGYRRIVATVFYVFPQWFMQRMILIAISYAHRDGLGISLRTIRERCSADVIWIYVSNGDLAMVQTLFKRGEASPFDVVAELGSSILEVDSTPILPCLGANMLTEFHHLSTC